MFTFMKKRNYLTLLTAYCLWNFPQSIIAPFFSLYIIGLGGTYSTIGFILGVSLVISTLSSIWGGYIADYYGRYKLIAIGSFSTGAVCFFLAIVPDWRWLMLAVGIQAVFNMFVPAQSAMLADSISPKRRGMGFATYLMIGDLARVFGPVIGGFLYFKYGFVALRWAFLIAFAFEMGSAAIKALFLRETFAKPNAVKRGFARLSAEAFKKTYAAIRWMPKALVGVASLLVLGTAILALVSPYLVIYGLDVIGLTSDKWGLIIAIQTAVGIAVAFPSGWVIDKFGRRASLFFSYCTTSALLIAFLHCRNFFQTAAVLSALIISQKLALSSSSALQADLTPRDKRGRVETAFKISLLAAFPASFLGGVLYSINYSLPFYVGSALAVAGLLVTLIIVREPEKPEI